MTRFPRNLQNTPRFLEPFRGPKSAAMLDPEDWAAPNVDHETIVAACQEIEDRAADFDGHLVRLTHAIALAGEDLDVSDIRDGLSDDLGIIRAARTAAETKLQEHQSAEDAKVTRRIAQ